MGGAVRPALGAHVTADPSACLVSMAAARWLSAAPPALVLPPIFSDGAVLQTYEEGDYRSIVYGVAAPAEPVAEPAQLKPLWHLDAYCGEAGIAKEARRVATRPHFSPLTSVAAARARRNSSAAIPSS